MIKKIKNAIFKNFFASEKKQLINEHLNKFKETNKETKLRELDFLYNNSTLENKHLQNAKLLSSRVELLKLLPKNSVGVELGVDHGDFSELILQNCSPSKLHLIDKWGDESRYHDGLKSLVVHKFEKEINEGKVIMNVGYSTDELKKIDSNYFDWAYLDTVHDYECTKKELILLADKVKNEGLICGHDFVVGNWFADLKYGVMEAVYEFCQEYNYEFVYLTMDYPNSFALRKIN